MVEMHSLSLMNVKLDQQCEILKCLEDLQSIATFLKHSSGLSRVLIKSLTQKIKRLFGSTGKRSQSLPISEILVMFSQSLQGPLDCSVKLVLNAEFGQAL